MTFHSQSVGFNMELAHLLQPQVMREGFPRDLLVRLWEFVSSCPSVSPDTDFGWCGLALLMNPIGVLSSGVQDSVEAHQVPPHQNLSCMCLWTLWGHFGSKRGLSQTVPSKVGTWKYPEFLGMLSFFHWNTRMVHSIAGQKHESSLYTTPPKAFRCPW